MFDKRVFDKKLCIAFSGTNRFFFGHEVAKNYLKHMPTNKTNLSVYLRASTTPKSLGKCTVSSGHSLLARTSDPLLCPSAHKGSAYCIVLYIVLHVDGGSDKNRSYQISMQ